MTTRLVFFTAHDLHVRAIHLPHVGEVGRVPLMGGGVAVDDDDHVLGVGLPAVLEALQQAHRAETPVGVVAGRVAPDVQERVLGDLLGLRRVADHPPDEAEHRRHVEREAALMLVQARGHTLRPIRLSASVDGRHLTSYVADGLIASTAKEKDQRVGDRRMRDEALGPGAAGAAAKTRARMLSSSVRRLSRRSAKALTRMAEQLQRQ